MTNVGSRLSSVRRPQRYIFYLSSPLSCITRNTGLYSEEGKMNYDICTQMIVSRRRYIGGIGAMTD
jgi:hypothetical protein